MNSIVTNTSQLKKINEERIRQAIKENPNSTKADIARETGLSLATCNNLLNEMIVCGEIIASELAPSSGGRPATQYIYNKDHHFALCLYVSNDGDEKKLVCAVVNALEEILEETQSILEHVTLDAIDCAIAGPIVRYPKIKVIGIGVPGRILNGVVEFCDIEELENVDLKLPLQNKYGIEVLVENDMDFIAYGYYMKYMEAHGADSKRNLAVIYFPKNNFPGCGLIVDNRLLKGSTMFAGEISFIPDAFGIPREEQLRLLNSQVEICDIIPKYLSAIISITNPQSIILLGALFESIDEQLIIQKCLDVIPKRHMPHLVISTELHSYYVKGLAHITIRSLEYGIPVIQRAL